MKLPKEFEYYLKNRIIRKSSQDKQRAEFLIKESKISLEEGLILTIEWQKKVLGIHKALEEIPV